DYEDPDHVLCLPKVIVFLQLLNSHGSNYFDSIRNWDKEKNKLLEAYGYSLNDDLKGKFEFAYKDGKPFLRVLNSNIKRVAPMPATNTYVKPIVIPQRKESEEQEVPEEEVIIKPTQKLGIVFNFTKKAYPQFTIDVILGEPNDAGDAFTGKAEKLDISRYVETEKLSEEDKQLLTSLRKLQEPEINKYISRNSPFSGIWENIIHQEEDDLPEETKELMAEYMLPKLKKLFAESAGNRLAFLLPRNKAFKTANLEQLQLVPEEAQPHFIVKAPQAGGAPYSIQCRV